MVDLTNCLIESVDLRKFVHEQKSLMVAEKNIITISHMIKRTKFTKSVCMVSLPIRPDLIKIVVDSDSKTKTISFKTESESNSDEDNSEIA